MRMRFFAAQVTLTWTTAVPEEDDYGGLRVRERYPVGHGSGMVNCRHLRDGLGRRGLKGFELF